MVHPVLSAMVREMSVRNDRDKHALQIIQSVIDVYQCNIIRQEKHVDLRKEAVERAINALQMTAINSRLAV